MSSTVLQVRVDEKLKNDANEIFKRLGLDMSSALRLFLKRTVADNGLPFSMTIQNENTKNDSDLNSDGEAKHFFNPVEFIENYENNKKD